MRTRKGICKPEDDEEDQIAGAESRCEVRRVRFRGFVRRVRRVVADVRSLDVV